MGLKQISHATIATGAAVITRELIDPGVLNAISCTLRVAGTSKGELHIRASVERGEQDTIFTVATLIDDYLYDGHLPSWDGQIPIDNNDYIVLTTWSSVVRTVFLNCATCHEEQLRARIGKSNE